MNTVAETLFNYLRDVINNPTNAKLDVETLPEDFYQFGKGLQFFADCVMQAKTLAQALSRGDLNGEVPPSYNEIAAPLKSLHASLRHMTWQAEQIAKGDYHQRVDFLGEFSKSFNSMAQQLEARREIETQERSKLQKFINLILLSTPNILLSFDTEGKAVFASESFICKNSVFPAEEIQGKTFSELFSPISSERFITEMGELFDYVHENKTSIASEKKIDIAQDGNERIYLIHITPMFVENETFLGIMVIFDDMTEIIRARELAEKSARVKSDFLARMSHEMHTPMNAIIGMASIGKSTPDIEKKNHSFKKIEDASAHLLGVISDILDMSKIEADGLDFIYNEFSFINMIRKVSSITSLLAAEKEQNFTADIDDNIPSCIVSDEKRLSQVIFNLLSNAVKFTPEHGLITLTARNIGEESGVCAIRFTVRDTGIGMSEEQQKHLFLPFEQADGGRSRRFGGTGLGLAISRSIIDEMEGSIWVESEPDKGASFTFDIKARIGAETCDLKIEKGSDPIDGIFSGKRILIAEDVEINREVISALLEDTGVEISFAVDGAEAVEVFLSDPELFNLILMDIQMPVVDGYEATKRIRSSSLPAADTIPIIAMTANVFREDVQLCLSAGMNGHLGKPVDIDEVIEKLREYL